jgi:hypothetical protein
MTTRSQIEHFWMLADAGKSAALDINTITGDLAVRCTRSLAGVEGKGTPPACGTDAWARVMSCINGEVTRGSER